ncbi:hypothetical protein CB0940_01460 [Cercospora beticola]|uniref:Nascent polypeptide-associated complex subunit alpha-like UBA domain-containing protein n=1 Tax=Cercospora beticola TaxID=122368 RepID=A0A2G5ICI7_CERBT|nr:hypothetical protein CB0940_01460 [Cercospora beticola]PIB02422.1 hypothetical protein CB0940_01460 [Cercospora beticola]WPA96898.1 hypothetical protein RHO25_001506 [Cercospora beticola]CAK1354724.1 unnamed protein product [Cercospora beticola]
MAEPQPPNVQEGADAPDVLPASKEDRKAAAALSSLDAPSEDVKPKKETDLKALNEAMKALMPAAKPKETASSTTKKDEAPKKVVKVDAADVALLVEQLDLNKTKATELLRAHDADVLKAIKAWVTATA